MAYLIKATTARRIYLIVGIRFASTYVERPFIVGISSIKGILHSLQLSREEDRYVSVQFMEKIYVYYPF